MISAKNLLVVAFVCMIPLAAHGLIYLFSNSLERWRLLRIAIAVFLMSQLLATTAPADYKADFDKHLAIEKRADKRVGPTYYVHAFPWFVGRSASTTVRNSEYTQK